jgi:hypothetical protein
MSDIEKWITVQLWRRKRKKGVTYALRYGNPKKPKTVGLGRCTEEHAELRRKQLEAELNRLPPEAEAGESDEERVRLVMVGKQLRRAGFGDDEVRKIVEIVRPYLRR